MKRLAPFLALALMMGGCGSWTPAIGGAVQSLVTAAFEWLVAGKQLVQVAQVATPVETDPVVAARRANDPQIAYAHDVRYELRLQHRQLGTVVVALCDPAASDDCAKLEVGDLVDPTLSVSTTTGGGVQTRALADANPIPATLSRVRSFRK